MNIRIKIEQRDYDALRQFAHEIQRNPVWMAALHRREDLMDFLRPHFNELNALDQTLRSVCDGMWNLVWYAQSQDEAELNKSVSALDLVRGSDIEANLRRLFVVDGKGPQLDLVFTNNGRAA